MAKITGTEGGAAALAVTRSPRFAAAAGSVPELPKDRAGNA